MKKERTQRSWIVDFLCVAWMGLGCACGGPDRPAHLPPPIYEEPQLPPWQPEEPPEDPLDQALEGEWVDEPPEEEATENEPVETEPDGPPSEGQEAPQPEPPEGISEPSGE